MTLALVGGEWSASRAGRFTPRERTLGTCWIGGWVGPRTGLDDVYTMLRSRKEGPWIRGEMELESPYILPAVDLYSSPIWPIPTVPKRLSLKKVITWLCLPTFLWADWLVMGGECRETRWGGKRNSTIDMWRGPRSFFQSAQYRWRRILSFVIRSFHARPSCALYEPQWAPVEIRKFLKRTIFWDITSCGPLKIKRFGGI
jgi:hypothetical protein